MPSTGEDRESPLSSAPVELLPRWPARTAAARVHRCSRTSTRPLVPCSRMEDRGRARSSGFCRTTFPRARLGTARTPPPPIMRWGRLHGTEFPRSGQTTEWARGQGPKSTAPRRSPGRLLASETSPQPRPSSSASCRDHRSLTLSGVTWGEKEVAIASRACMARERQGRATPSFREETRRSPTRGTFHHEIVRERTKAPHHTSELGGSDAHAFFTAAICAQGTPACKPGSSANRTRRPANQPRVDRPQRPS